MKKSQALTTMKLTLKPEHQKLIEAKLDTGRYANPDEIIAEALQLLSKRDRYQQWAIEFDPPQSPLKKGDFLEFVRGLLILLPNN
jgi:antitoxin ParD1/3/4